MKHLGDITKINGAEIEPVDCITGGSPCQDLSVAGKRAGLAGERSGLFMEQMRIVKEMRAADVQRGRTGIACRPRYMVWENVPGAFSSGSPKGADFAAVLEEIVKVCEKEAPAVPVPEKGWPTAGCLYDEVGGWSIAWRVHDARFWGVPQRRKRIALVADFGGLSAPEILFERKGLRGDFEQSGAEGQGAAADAEGCTRGAVGVDIYNQKITGDVAASLTAACGGTSTSGAKVLSISAQNNQAVVFNINYSGALRCGLYVRRLTPLECERLQGFPDGWTDIGDWVDSKGKKHKAADSPRYKALGNSIALPFWKYLCKRISAQYERDATLGSLFDGIGGFPLCWERVNGKGSARWASEIEEFPIAVTKARFGGE